MQKGLIRVGVYDIDTILKLLKSGRKKHTFITRHGNIDVKLTSQRYLSFLINGIKCVHCGKECSYMALERFYDQDIYHLNAYAKSDSGKEVLMTKDHIVPKSRGGRNCINNYQTMCVNCNTKKADKLR